MRSRFFALAAAGSVLLAFGVAGGAPTVGSPNTATADPPVAVPDTTPCVVPLFAGLTFADFSPKLFSYAPPAGCAGPWAKVVLAADFSVTAGRQFDRTASIWLGATNVYFGTTAEPSRTVSPAWHIESDLTDYSPLFKTSQPGMVQLDNLVNDTFTGILSGAAELRFYPVARRAEPPRTADVVLPLSNGPTGGTVGLATTASRLARTFTLPTNIERAVLDVYAQSQSGDEFWYTCVPDDLTGPLQSCGATGFREAEITVDGRPAGVAPIYPWIYTGGIDPNLWKPIPGVQTLNFTPYRVDLTPFAGMLSDGAPHEVAVSVFNANNFFATTASLLLFLDPHARTVRGAVTADTLTAAPTPSVTTSIVTAADGTISGPVNVTSSRQYRIAGFVDTSHGRVTTEVTGEIRFANRQQFTITAATYHQQIAQTTTVLARTSRIGGGAPSEQVVALDWPLSVDFAFTSNADGSGAQTTSIDQRFERTDTTLAAGRLADVQVVVNHVAPTDTLNFDATGAVTSSTGQVSSQQLFSADARGHCFSRDLTAAAGLLTSVVDGKECGR
ncbi:MAG TPA: peptide-N4-asparagine amidase [Kofleriaceae bacterium]|nr:peptide-N4-asparagine amidase [Kofleriaceae bacterium]